MRVDQYTATVPGLDGGEALAWLMEALPEVEGLEVGKNGDLPAYHYEHAVPVRDGRTVVAVARWGGNGDVGANIELKGSVADDTFGLLRARWPEHQVSRMDVAADGSAPGLFDDTFRHVLRVIESLPSNRRPKLDQRGDWSLFRGGRSCYIGTKDGGVLVCLYEKGKERQERAGLANQDLDWVRMELRVYPAKREGKLALAQIQPVDAWGLSKWATDVLEAFNGLRPAPVQLPGRPRDDDRTWSALLAQYGPFLERQAEGQWESFGKRLEREIGGLRRRRVG